MSLALWEFFWDWDSAAPAPSPSPTPAPGPATPLPPPPSDGGGGGGKGKGHKPPRQLLPSPQDLWDVREKYLRSLHPPQITPAPRPEEYEAEANRVYLERQQEIEQATADRAAAISALRNSEDLKTMKSLGGQIKELNAKIATLTNKQAFARFMK